MIHSNIKRRKNTSSTFRNKNESKKGKKPIIITSHNSESDN
jgi:hypothetical protein